MKKKTAILVDAEWFRKLLKRALTAAISQQASAITTTVTTQVLPAITADTFYRNACLALDTTEEELFRFFCYDCEPFDKPQRNPIDHSWVRFGSGNPKYIERMTFFRELGAMPFVALRRGIVKGRGWEIRDNVANALLTATQTNVALAATDIQYGLEQKGVDMRIGMDFATLSLKRLVDRIILLSGDTDMVPAMKLARREGVQVCVVQIGNGGRLAPPTDRRRRYRALHQSHTLGRLNTNEILPMSDEARPSVSESRNAYEAHLTSFIVNRDDRFTILDLNS